MYSSQISLFLLYIFSTSILFLIFLSSLLLQQMRLLNLSGSFLRQSLIYASSVVGLDCSSQYARKNAKKTNLLLASQDYRELKRGWVIIRQQVIYSSSSMRTITVLAGISILANMPLPIVLVSPSSMYSFIVSIVLQCQIQLQNLIVSPFIPLIKYKLQLTIMEGDYQQFYFDAHNHLLDYSQQQLLNVVNQAIQNNVLFCSPNTTRQSQYSRMMQISQKYPIQPQQQLNKHHKTFQIVPSFGIHPCFLQHQSANLTWLQNLTKVISLNQHYAIGQIGIDFRKDILQLNPKQRQYDFFTKQLQLSFTMNRPVTVHCVRAHGQLLKIFKKYNRLFDTQANKLNQSQQYLKTNYRQNPIILHSYGGSKEITTSLLKLNHLNLYFSLCLKRSEDLSSVIPIERLILQTDAPYQNNPQLLKQQFIIPANCPPQHELDNRNRVQYVRANVGSLSPFYQMERGLFSKTVFENTLKAFRLLKPL